MRRAVSELNVLARRALGEEVKTNDGGLFGRSGVKADAAPATGEALVKALTDARRSAVDAFNSYCGENNDGHPLDIDPLKTIPAD